MQPVACAYCGRPSDELHRDHVVPRSRGGPDDASNIVMACRACNFAKRDSLASEWLGDECPERVLRIEERVNAKLAKRFAKRDYKARRLEAEAEKKLFAFHLMPNGEVDYIGEVASESGDTIRLDVIDAVMSVMCGAWYLTGELIELPKRECRMFNDQTACYESAMMVVHRNKRLAVK